MRLLAAAVALSLAEGVASANAGMMGAMAGGQGAHMAGGIAGHAAHAIHGGRQGAARAPHGGQTGTLSRAPGANRATDHGPHPDATLHGPAQPTPTGPQTPPDLRAVAKDIGTAAQQGQLKAAALKLPPKGTQMSASEQRALKKAQRVLFNKAIKEMKYRSKIGNVDGAGDAHAALQLLRKNGELTWFQNFRAWWAEGLNVPRWIPGSRLLKNAQKAAIRQGRPGGNLLVAAKNVALIQSLKGQTHRVTKAARGRLLKNAWKQAWHHARQGSLPQMQQALHIATDPDITGKPAADTLDASTTKKIGKIEKLGMQRSVTKYVWDARNVAKRDPAAAARLLARSKIIEEDPRFQVRPGFFARWQQRRLMTHLGDLVAQAIPGERQSMQMEIQQAINPDGWMGTPQGPPDGLQQADLDPAALEARNNADEIAELLASAGYDPDDVRRALADGRISPEELAGLARSLKEAGSSPASQTPPQGQDGADPAKGDGPRTAARDGTSTRRAASADGKKPPSRRRSRAKQPLLPFEDLPRQGPPLPRADTAAPATEPRADVTPPPSDDDKPAAVQVPRTRTPRRPAPSPLPAAAAPSPGSVQPPVDMPGDGFEPFGRP